MLRELQAESGYTKKPRTVQNSHVQGYEGLITSKGKMATISRRHKEYMNATKSSNKTGESREVSLGGPREWTKEV